MWNVKFNHKARFTFCLFKQRKMNKQNKTKQLLKFIKVFYLPILTLNNKSYQFHAAHAILPQKALRRDCKGKCIE